MTTDTALDKLSTSELIALVQDLRRQLAKREHEIAQLKQPQPTMPPTAPASNPAGSEPIASEAGTLEDLLAQLEREYPEG